jgi:hypothetical protein
MSPFVQVFGRRLPDFSSAIVKGFGRRLLTRGQQMRAAGVRKPPREETAVWERRAVGQSLWGLSAANKLREWSLVVEYGD